MDDAYESETLSSILSELDSSLRRPDEEWPLSERSILALQSFLKLSGEVPDPAEPSRSCDGLKILDLGKNQFQGPFPEFITSFRGLEELDLSSNHFSGPIPDALARIRNLTKLNLSYNNFTGPLPASLQESRFTAEAFQGNNLELCGPPLGKCGSRSSGLTSGAIAGIVIGLLAGVVVLASVTIGWVQGNKRKNKGRKADEEVDIVFEEEGNHGGGDGRLMVFQGGEHLTLDDVLNATGQVLEKTSYGTVYKANSPTGATLLSGC